MMDLRTEDLVRLRGEASGMALARACESILGGLLHGNLSAVFQSKKQLKCSTYQDRLDA